MSESVIPTSPVSFGETPVNSAFTVFEIIFVISEVIVTSFLPVKLSQSMHFALNPSTIICFSIEPSVLAISVKLIFLEGASVVLGKLCFSEMFQKEIRVVNKGDRFKVVKRWSLPRIFLFEKLADLLFEVILSKVGEVVDLFDDVCRVFISIVCFYSLVLLFLFLLELVANKESQISSAYFVVLFELSIVSCSFELFNAFSAFHSINKLSFVVVDIFTVFDFHFSLSVQFSHFECPLKLLSPRKNSTLSVQDDLNPQSLIAGVCMIGGVFISEEKLGSFFILSDHQVSNVVVKVDLAHLLIVKSGHHFSFLNFVHRVQSTYTSGNAAGQVTIELPLSHVDGLQRTDNIWFFEFATRSVLPCD